MSVQVSGEHWAREGRPRFCETCSLYHVAGARCRPDLAPPAIFPGDVSIFDLVIREAQLEDDARRAGVAAGVRAALAAREAGEAALWARIAAREQDTRDAFARAAHYARPETRRSRFVQDAPLVAHVATGTTGCALGPARCAMSATPCEGAPS